MQNIKQVLTLLKKHYQNAKYYLEFKSPLNLLVGAILSAQARDEVVNATMQDLPKKITGAGCQIKKINCQSCQASEKKQPTWY